jgi:predicted Zn-dependent protease
LASKLAPQSEIGYLATAHEKLFVGDVAGAIEAARAGIKHGYENHALLEVLGEALIRSGATPGEPDFLEAQAVLEKAVTQQSNDVTSQIALGNLYLMSGRLDGAIAHLEKARQIDPEKPSVYANLAKAYQRRGNLQRSKEALAILEKLNHEQADRINAAPGDRKLGYADRTAGEALPVHP